MEPRQGAGQSPAGVRGGTPQKENAGESSPSGQSVQEKFSHVFGPFRIGFVVDTEIQPFPGGIVNGQRAGGKLHRKPRSCPADAVEEVKRMADFISPHFGGRGAVRDFVEWLLA